MMVLDIRDLSKAFSKHKLYQNLNYQFGSGHYCLVGPNGVGKSIFLEMLAGVLPQDGGFITLRDIGNADSICYKQRLVYVPSKPHFFPMTTGLEFLNFIAAVKRVSLAKAAVDAVVEGFKLRSHLSTKFKDMSLGTQKKLFLSTLVIGSPSLIILDEPTNGLDAESQAYLASLLAKFGSETISIVATHDPSLMEDMPHTLLKLSAAPTLSFEVQTKHRLLHAV